MKTDNRNLFIKRSRRAVIIGRAYQRPLPRHHMTDGSLKYQASVIRRYAKTSDPLPGTWLDAIIGATALVVFFLLVMFIPEFFR